MYDLPTSVWALVLLAVIGLPAATCVALYRGAVAAGAGRRAASAVATSAAAGLGAWLVVSAALANAGVYRQDPGETVPWLAAAVVGALGALLLATRVPLVARILAAPGAPTLLTLPHTFRVAGVSFLLVMVLGRLPAAFALPAGLGDIAIGVTAPFVARRLARGTGDDGAVRFNLLGILDLVVAGGIGFLLQGPIPVTPSTAPLTMLPLALILTVPVPLAVALHLVSLRRLRRAAHHERDRADRLLPVAG